MEEAKPSCASRASSAPPSWPLFFFPACSSMARTHSRCSSTFAIVSASSPPSPRSVVSAPARRTLVATKGEEKTSSRDTIERRNSANLKQATLPGGSVAGNTFASAAFVLAQTESESSPECSQLHT